MIDHISQLNPDPRNARKHNPRNIGMIANALQEVGAARSIVIDEDNNILAGNGTIEAAAQVGIERLRVIEADGNEIIAVRRKGLSKKAKKRLALYDNRTAELAEWDVDVLSDERDVLEGLFNDNELARVLGELEDFDADGLWKGMPEFENEAQAARTLHVHFPTEQDVTRFCQLLSLGITSQTKSVWFPARPEQVGYSFTNES